MARIKRQGHRVMHEYSIIYRVVNKNTITSSTFNNFI